MTMKKSLIAAAICSLFSYSIYAQSYSVVIGKEENKYNVKPATGIPSSEKGVNAVVKNANTNQEDSGNIQTEYLSINVESGDQILIQTDAKQNPDRNLILSGYWNANTNLSFDNNSMDYASFYVPDYDGEIFLTLNLEDGEYSKKYLPISLISEYWQDTDSLYGDWSTINVVEDWTPSLSSYYENEIVEQNRTIDRERTVQDREIRTSTGNVRNKGDEYIETDLSYLDSRSEYGTLAYWKEIEPIVISDWTVSEILENWSPDASNVYEIETVNQSREVKKERVIQKVEYRPATDETRNKGSQVKDITLTTEYQTVQGSLEYWVNTGESSCTEWTFDRYDDWYPEASDYARDQTVEQTRTGYDSRECSGEQYRPATDETRLANAEVEYRSYVENRSTYGTKINLNDWSANDSNGSWSVSNDGSYAYQSINGEPTVFESSANTYGNTIITGKIRIRNDGDDDFVGMVFGKTSDSNFYLWSWKRNNQAINGGTSYEGQYLAHVTGGVSAITWFMDKDSTGYDNLDSYISTSAGWNYDTYYNFEIKYTPTYVSITVNGTKVLEASGSFPDGKIGFFNLSQSQVEYYKVTDSPL